MTSTPIQSTSATHPLANAEAARSTSTSPLQGGITAGGQPLAVETALVPAIASPLKSPSHGGTATLTRSSSLDARAAFARRQELRLPDYYVPVDPAQEDAHAGNQRRVLAQLDHWGDVLCDAWQAGRLDHVADALHLDPAEVEAAYAIAMKREDRGVGAQGGTPAHAPRAWPLFALALPTVLAHAEVSGAPYGARDPANRFAPGRYLIATTTWMGQALCVQGFGFEPGQRTVVHPHPHECGSYVVQGQLKERLYAIPERPGGGRPAPGSRPADRQDTPVLDPQPVHKLATNRRAQGSFAKFSPHELDIPHSLLNSKHSEVIAVSMHGYDMDGFSPGQIVAAKVMYPYPDKAPTAARLAA